MKQAIRLASIRSDYLAKFIVLVPNDNVLRNSLFCVVNCIVQVVKESGCASASITRESVLDAFMMRWSPPIFGVHSAELDWMGLCHVLI
jgi:hypothetical protein